MMNFIHVLFTLLYLLYIALTQSFFVQCITLIIFYFIAWFDRQPKKNWYYNED